MNFQNGQIPRLPRIERMGPHCCLRNHRIGKPGLIMEWKRPGETDHRHILIGNYNEYKKIPKSFDEVLWSATYVDTSL